MLLNSITFPSVLISGIIYFCAIDWWFEIFSGLIIVLKMEEVSIWSTRVSSPQLRTPYGADDMLDSVIDIDHEYILDNMTRVEKHQIGFSREKILNLYLME